MSAFTVALSGMTPEQTTKLNDYGIINDIDLGTLSQSDFDQLLPSATIVVRRRLYSIGQYATSGETIDASTTMLDILTRLNRNTSPPSGANLPTHFIADPTRGAPKMYVDGSTDFAGAPIKWEDWSIGTGTTLGQTVYSSLLSAAPGEHDVQAKTRDRERELYFMFKKALYQGAAYHIVERTASIESGYQVW
jgi:hypothetical protein